MWPLTDIPLPALDCHAHIAEDVTRAQLDALGDVTVFAVTRSLDEGDRVTHMTDDRVIWGCGVHPGLTGARRVFSVERFRQLIPSFALVGEVGLDRRSGHLEEQRSLFRSILEVIREEPVLVSVHSAGCTNEIVHMVSESPHPGIILHWFLGSHEEVKAAAAIGCYFSVNNAMPDDSLSLIPPDRILPETDYPATARKGVRQPGDVSTLESRLAALYGEPPQVVRRRFYHNLRTIAVASGAIDRLPNELADRLLAVTGPGQV